MPKFWIFLIPLLFILTGCGNSEKTGDSSLADLLPLAKDKPTFIFFYTDG